MTKHAWGAKLLYTPLWNVQVSLCADLMRYNTLKIRQFRCTSPMCTLVLADNSVELAIRARLCCYVPVGHCVLLLKYCNALP